MWNYDLPPTIGEHDIIWYYVLLNDNSVDIACWWCNHWYCFSKWNDILAWKDIK